MTKELLDKLERIEALMTPGPWRADVDVTRYWTGKWISPTGTIDIGKWDPKSLVKDALVDPRDAADFEGITRIRNAARELIYLARKGLDK